MKISLAEFRESRELKISKHLQMVFNFMPDPHLAFPNLGILDVKHTFHFIFKVITWESWLLGSIWAQKEFNWAVLVSTIKNRANINARKTIVTVEASFRDHNSSTLSIKQPSNVIQS